MPRFNIINSFSEITLCNQWSTPSKFNCKNKIVTEEGRFVSLDTEGRRYQIIDKRERNYSKLERLERFTLGVFATLIFIFSFGFAINTKTIKNLFTKSKKTSRFAIPVTDSLPVSSQVSKDLTLPSDTRIPRPQKGIPNPHNRACWLNSAALALYPIHSLFEKVEHPIIKKLVDVYKNPEVHYRELEDGITTSLNVKKGWNDASLALSHLISTMCKADSKIYKLFHANVESFNCGNCHAHHNASTRGFIFSRIFNRDKTCRLSEEVKKSFNASFATCESRPCSTQNVVSSCTQKYFLYTGFFGNLSSKMLLDTPEFSWRNQKFRVLSAIEGGTGHATCTIRGDDNQWYKYNNQNVEIVDPHQGQYYTGFLIENMSVL